MNITFPVRLDTYFFMEKRNDVRNKLPVSAILQEVTW